MKGGSSLAQLLRAERSVKPTGPGVKKPLKLEDVLLWADRHFRETGAWPRRDSGEVRGVPGEDWANIDAALKSGGRGLGVKSSLIQLLAEKRDLDPRARQPRRPLTEDQILKWADAHFRATGGWPNINSGNVIGVPTEQWANINTALAQGHRGLPGGSSLRKLLREKRNVTRRRMGNRPALSLPEIRRWIREHREHTGAWPTQTSGRVNANGVSDENWKAIDVALQHGLRGLPGGSSLSKLKRTMGKR